MATLKNTEATVEILFFTKKSKRKEWLNYKIEVYILIPNTGEKVFLENISLINEEDLFLDAYYEPEIPLLVEGIRRVVIGDADFFAFTPVDEKDFVLELGRGASPETFLLSFFSDKNVRHVWNGIRISIDGDAINRFIDDILQEITAT